jgi:threonine dehydrogenase-like Zn-dependent dehydrogenase
MRAVVYTSPLTLEDIEWPDPAPLEGEVLVSVRAVGICGSELEGVRNNSPFRVAPLVMGHEFCGVRLDTGERVAVNPLVTCGYCDLCLSGLSQICRSRQIIGVHRPGGFAELVSVPTGNCCVLPASVSDVQGALVEPFANAVHAKALGTKLLSGKPASKVGVIGAGAIGLAVATVCAEDADITITLSELDERRRAQAASRGQFRVVDELSGEFDLVFDAVGSGEARKASIDLVRPGGVAVWVGLYSAEAALQGQDFVRAEKRVVGSFAYSAREFAEAVSIVAATQPLWAETYPLERGAEVFSLLLREPGVAPRTVLVAGQDLGGGGVSR